MSGTTSICLTQQVHNATHEPLVGGLLYSFQAGTLNPQNAYRTSALTAGTEFPNPLTLDASGRIPQMFYADGVIRLILTDSLGVAQFDYDNVPILGSSAGGGGVDTTDVTRLYGTGDVKLKYGSGVLAGYVRGNARTIGSATSGATELADATAQALFQYFWNQSAADLSLAVLPDRGVSAVADWTANKQIETPDFRGYVIGGVDGMGNSRANRLAASKWDSHGIAFGGVEAPTITLANMPLHKHDVSVTGVSVSGSYSGSASVTVPALSGDLGFRYDGPGAFGGGLQSGSGLGFVQGGSRTITVNGSGASGSSSGSFSGSGSATISEANKGSGTAFNITQPTRLVTVYFRL